MKAGVFVFVTQAKQADLKIEMVPRSQTSDEGGIFTNTEGRIGRIEVAVYGSGGDEREFRLRTVLIHEIGHAFGLDHLPERKCNFMSPMLYTCFSDERQECRTDAPDTRCLSVQLAQIRPIEKLLPARTAKPLPRK